MGVPQLERYKVIEELGQGGMSVVYRARDRQLNREVALKVLHDFLARQPEARRRFHREAVAVAKLAHPGIVEIFDYSGPDAEQSYIVCELIDGRTLRALVEQEGPVSHPELAALVTAELTRALRHAHEQGVIHRDLKPENIMITRDGRLKLMDFGIAQIMGGSTRLTATGTLLGSPAHMAPEMIDGHPCDHRGDIFSVGTILYWLATGALPFDAPNPSALFRQILEGEYEPAQAVQPRVGNGLARVIDRALALDPNDRYQDIAELQDDLHAELDPMGLTPVEASARGYLARPRPFSDELRPDLIARLTQAGQDALEEGNVGRAMDRFNRVLAVEPNHPEVLALVRKVGRRRAIAARLRQAALASLTLLGLTGIGTAAYVLWPAPAASRVPPSKQAKSAPVVAALPATRAPDVRSADSPSSPPAPPPPLPPLPPLPPNASPMPRAKQRAPSAKPPGGPGASPKTGRPTTALKTGGPTATRSKSAPATQLTKTQLTKTQLTKTQLTKTGPNVEATRAEPTPNAVSGDVPDSGQPESPEPGRELSSARASVSATTRFPLLLRMHPGWANVFVNGIRVAEGAYRKQLRLAEGRHVIAIENEFGRPPPRVIRVATDGTMVEVRPNGSTRPIKGELPIYTPGPAVSGAP